ncbi:MAG TPA: DUF4214 domain-containing protein [Gemmataceae bacterium]|nr:DUF4214 domain-containing protein [Gemmataceae bacterium]
MNPYSMLRNIVRPGTTKQRTSQSRLGRRPQLETLEERAVPTVSLPTDPFLFTPLPEMKHDDAVHIKARVEIFLDGKQIPIQADLGVFGKTEDPIHTHDNSGNLQIESPFQRDFELTDFLAIWNTTPQGQAAIAKLEAAADITVLVNGKLQHDLNDITLHKHDTIIISAVSAPSAPRLTPNQLFVTQLYADLLHRAPDASGLATWTSDLDQGMSRTQVAQGIEANAEFMTVEVKDLYRTLLHRSADAAGLAGFVSFLSGGGNIQQVESTILGSTEFFQNAGATSAGFTTALYQDVLQRQPDATGMAAFQAALATGANRDQLAGTLLHNQEAETLMVQAIYQQYLNRPADNTGLASFLAMLQQGATREQVIADIMGSQEYFNGA